jgi:hypothetical protein
MQYIVVGLGAYIILPKLLTITKVEAQTKRVQNDEMVRADLEMNTDLYPYDNNQTVLSQVAGEEDWVTGRKDPPPRNYWFNDLLTYLYDARPSSVVDYEGQENLMDRYNN